MKILALENSGAAASIAVAEDGIITAERRFDAPRGRGAGIFTILEELRPFWSGLDRIALGLGPGSSNGLRVACALAGSFRLALDIPIVGVPSPCLLDVDETDYLAVGDARGGQIHVARVSGRALRGEIRLLPHAELAREVAETGIAVYRTGPLDNAGEVTEARPSAVVLARLAASLEPLGPGPVLPIYLKPPHITQPRDPAPRLASQT